VTKNEHVMAVKLKAEIGPLATVEFCFKLQRNYTGFLTSLSVTTSSLGSNKTFLETK
jgi:hypothetical protein